MSEENTTPKELTPEQIARQDEFIAKWRKIGLASGECNFEVASKAVAEAYKVANLTPPPHIIGPYNSPYEGALAARAVIRIAEEQIDFDDTAHLARMVQEEVDAVIASGEKPSDLSMSGQVYGSMEYWLAFYDYMQEVVGLDLNEINPLVTLAQNCGWWIPLHEVAILQHRPLEVHLDDRDRLRNTSGPAVKYRGNCEFSQVYAINGVRVTKKIVDRDYTAEDVENEENQEVKRVMIEHFRNPETGEEGQHEYLKASNAQKLSTDDWGTLWKKEIEEDEPLMMVEVLNSTAEPDGHFKTYFLRVDPNAYGGLEKLPPRAAIASTFRDPEDQTQMMFENWEDYEFQQES